MSLKLRVCGYPKESEELKTRTAQRVLGLAGLKKDVEVAPSHITQGDAEKTPKAYFHVHTDTRENAEKVLWEIFLMNVNEDVVVTGAVSVFVSMHDLRNGTWRQVLLAA